MVGPDLVFILTFLKYLKNIEYWFLRHFIVNAKWFYLIQYAIALRTSLLLPLHIELFCQVTNNAKGMKIWNSSVLDIVLLILWISQAKIIDLYISRHSSVAYNYIDAQFTAKNRFIFTEQKSDRHLTRIRYLDTRLLLFLVFSVWITIPLSTHILVIVCS